MDLTVLKSMAPQPPKTSLEAYLVELDKLKQHEEVDPKHLKELTVEIASDKILKYAIVVDKNTNIIIDGEHRYNVLKNLGCKMIPVVYIDYNSPKIEVQSWRIDYNLEKKAVIEAGLSHIKLPPKTSKHMIRNSDKLTHISTVEKKLDVPLEILKNNLELVEMENVKTAMLVDFKDTLPYYTKFLAEEMVDTPIILEKETNVLLNGYEAYHALELLSVEKAPALKVDINSVEIKSPENRKIDKETIIQAGVKGPKLPWKSFKMIIEPIKINMPLTGLSSPKKAERKGLRVYSNPLELLIEGWPTPLVKLNSLSTENRSVWAKLEFYNPFSNSVKDRIGWYMLKDALEKGLVKEALYEATSTNTGIALASIANIYGLKARLYIPKKVQKTSDTYLKILGAEVVRLPVELTVQAIRQIDSEAKTQKATHLNQFENDANLKVHLKYTAKEIDEQLKSIDLKPTCIIGSLGTSGHMSAISIYFKNKYKDKVKIIGVQPAEGETIPGIRRIETGMKWIHWTSYDKIVDVKQKEALQAAVSIARREGLLIGISAGAVIHAFNKMAEEKGVYVLIIPDSGYKYIEQFERYLETTEQ
jgi:cysteine synthase/O-phosphoserine sulfhydrylase/cystathionine beta-synthase